MIIMLFTFLHCSKKVPVSSENVNASFQLQGTVSDNGADFLGNGAEPVANALVTITDQTDTNRTFSSYTDEEGHYLIEIPQTSALLKASYITRQESGTQVSSQYSLTISGDNIAPYVEHDIDIPVTRTLDVSVTRIVIDIDGNEYQTVKIGDQWWTSQNLKTTRYRNGDPIPNITDNSEWVKLKTSAYCVYNNTDSMAHTYGFLYNCYAIEDDRNIAPEGWHVPTSDEWQALVDYLGGGSVAGGKLKGPGTTHWSSPNIGATNESGFSALPGGYRNYSTGFFEYLGNYANFWSATEINSYIACYQYLYYNNSNIHHNYYYKYHGFSVRLISD